MAKLTAKERRRRLRFGYSVEEQFIEKADYLHLKSSYMGRRTSRRSSRYLISPSQLGEIFSAARMRRLLSMSQRDDDRGMNGRFKTAS
jgi:hypothetical protein